MPARPAPVSLRGTARRHRRPGGGLVLRRPGHPGARDARARRHRRRLGDGLRQRPASRDPRPLPPVRVRADHEREFRSARRGRHPLHVVADRRPVARRPHRPRSPAGRTRARGADAGARASPRRGRAGRGRRRAPSDRTRAARCRRTLDQRDDDPGGAARLLLDEGPDRAEEPLMRVEETGRETLSEMRRLLGVLRQDEPINKPWEARGAAVAGASRRTARAVSRGGPPGRARRRGRRSGCCRRASTSLPTASSRRR